MAIEMRNETPLEAIKQAAEEILISARTAPKSKGIDKVHTALVYGDDLEKVACEMEKISAECGAKFFLRDAGNIRESAALILIGTELGSLGIPYCGMCGYKDCQERNENPEHPCALNTIDLGIAIGSAVSRTMDLRVDNRIMFSAGVAAKNIGYFDKKVKIIFGIPIAVCGKNPFFDRKRPASPQ